MLEMDPFARYPTYESLQKDMANALTPLLEARSGKKPEKKKSVVAPVMAGLVALALIGGLTYLGMHLFRQQQAEKRAQAERAADIAAGRLRQVMRGGQLVWIRVDPDPAATTPPSAPEATAPVSEWTLRATHDVAIAGDNSADFKEITTLLLLAGTETKLEEASKIYLRFPLKGVDRARLEQATLQLTASRRGRAKPKTPHYKLHVWALNSPQDWQDDMTWTTAPGNNPASTGGMQDSAAVLLTSFDIPPHPETGDRIQISARPLLQFIRDYPHDDLTLVLTGDMDTDHRGGWRFTSTEDAQRFPPPTLILKAK
jgi:hypothetical protein